MFIRHKNRTICIALSALLVLALALGVLGYRRFFGPQLESDSAAKGLLSGEGLPRVDARMGEADRRDAERRLLQALSQAAPALRLEILQRLEQVAGAGTVAECSRLLGAQPGPEGFPLARVLVSSACRTEGEALESAAGAVLKWALTVRDPNRQTVNLLVRGVYALSRLPVSTSGTLRAGYKDLLVDLGRRWPGLRAEAAIGLRRLEQGAVQAGPAGPLLAQAVSRGADPGGAVSLAGPAQTPRFERCEMEVGFSGGWATQLAQLSAEDYFDTFDGDEDLHFILVEAQVTRPDSIVELVPAFLDFNPQTGFRRWLIRYAPPKAGGYAVRLHVELGVGTAYSRAFPGLADFSFSCIAGNKPGPLQKAQGGENPAYFYREDSTGTRVPFLGKGYCRAWVADHSPDTPASQGWPGQPAGSAAQEAYRASLLDSLQASGGNLLSHWLAPWETMLVHQRRPSALLPAAWSSHAYIDQDRAGRLDRLVQQAEAEDIALLVCLWPHPALRDVGHSWSYPRWDAGYDAGEAFSPGPPPEEERNGFSGLGTLQDFFKANESGSAVERRMWRYQKSLYRYILARWGYSRAVGPWEVVSEIQGTEGWRGGNGDALGNGWHDRVLSYLRATDWVRRPAGSSTHDASVWTGGAQQNDYLNSHLYLPGTWWGVEAGQSGTPNVNDTQTTWNDLVGRIAAWSASAGTARPALLGEFGLQEMGLAPTPGGGSCDYYSFKKYNPTFVHYALWAGLLTGNAVLPLEWNDGTRFGEMTTGQYDGLAQLGNVGAFAAQLDPAASANRVTLPSGDFTNAAFRGYGLVQADRARACYWIQDTGAQSGSLKAGPSWTARTGVTATLRGLNAGKTYRLRWWNTWNGMAQSAVSNYTANGSGDLVAVPVPALSNNNNTGEINRDVACVVLEGGVPVIAATGDTQIVRGGVFSGSGSFTDADSSTWTATVDYGDGTGTQPLSLSGNTFGLSHQYNSFGQFTITVAVTDEVGAKGTAALILVVDDRFEENDALAGATALSVLADDSFHDYPDLFIRDDDWYRITVPAGKNLVGVRLDFAPGYGTYDLDLYLKTPAGVEVAKSESGGSGEFLSATVTAGDYYIQVTGWGGARNSYALSILVSTSANIVLPELLAVELPNPGDSTILGSAEPLASLLNSATASPHTVSHDRLGYQFPLGWTLVTWTARDSGGGIVGVKSERVYVFRHGQTPIGVSKFGAGLSQYGDTAYSGAANHGAHVARDAGGAIHVAWLEKSAAGIFRILYRRGVQDPGSGSVVWQIPAQEVSAGTANGNSFVAMASSPAAVHFTWTDSAGRIRYRRLKLEGGVWSLEAARDTGATGGSSDNCPDIAAFNDDEVHVLSRSLKYAHTLDGGSSWSAVEDLWANSFTQAPGATGSKYPSLTVDALGRVHAVYTATIRNNYWQLWYLRRDRPLPGAVGSWVESANALAAFPEWGDPGSSSSSGILADWAEIEADASNNLHLAWHGTALTGIFGQDNAYYMNRPADGGGYGLWRQPLLLHREQGDNKFSWSPSLGWDVDSDLTVPVFFYKALGVGNAEDYSDMDSALRVVRDSIYLDGGLLNGDQVVPLSQAANTPMSTWWPTAARRLYRNPSNGRGWLDVMQCMKTKDGSGWTYLIHQRYEMTALLPPARVRNPDPPHQACAVPVSKVLGWDPAQLAVNYDVYFGTNRDSVAAATLASPEYKGRIAATSYNPGTLGIPQTYYWRIDAVNSRGVTKGLVWRFQTGANSTPELQSYLPAGDPVYLRYGTATVFSVSAVDADLHDLTYTWTLDGSKVLRSGGVGEEACGYGPSSPIEPNHTLTVTIGDGTSTVTHSWTLITNNPPTANNQTVWTQPGIPVDILLNASDLQGDPLTYSVQSPTYGSLSGTAPTVVYIPPAGFEGTDTFKFRAHDGKEWSAEATVTVNVTLTGFSAAWWRLDESTGTTAADSSGSGNGGTLVNNPVWTAGKINNALQLNGSSQYFYGNSLITGPNVFTLALWFKTTTSSGGKLIGLGNLKTGLSASYDRHIYMSNTGQLYFGVNPGTTKTVNSPGTYRDGAWHHVAARLSSAGMALFVDGQQVATDPTVTSAQAFNGYWRVGYDKVTSWPSAPSSPFFNGTVDDVRVYNRALDQSAIQSLALASPLLALEWGDVAGDTAPRSWAPALTDFGAVASTGFSVKNRSTSPVDLKATASATTGQAWYLSATPGAVDAAKLEASPDGSAWTSLHGGNRATLATGLAVNGIQAFQLRFTAPASSSEYSGTFPVSIVAAPK